MKILQPVRELPEIAPVKSRCLEREEMRRQAYKAAKRANGLWLPVVFDNDREAAYMANAARQHSMWLFEVERRGLTCYLRFLGRVGFQPIHTPSADLEARRTLERIQP